MFEPPYCAPPEFIKRESLPYYDYYLGEKEDDRRHGQGQNCWTGPESIEWHCGRFVHDTMHGPGEYRLRYRGKTGEFMTYEGPLYLNRMHGYGAMSYPDGKVYTGLFNNDIRYGPGIETFADVRANVGLWRGTKLVRLAWRPELRVAPDFQATAVGRALVNPQRIVLHTAFKVIDKVNQAIEFLKQHGSDPVAATENWTKLYPNHCTDLNSQLCPVELFDYEYYNGKIYSLTQDFLKHGDEDLEKYSQNSLESLGPYYAWNNDAVIIDMMKHSFKHERQREQVNIDLTSVLSGPRNLLKPPAMHELDCRTLLMACYLGHVASTTFLVNERNVDPNIADMLGNTAVMYAACGDQAALVNFLVEAGADVDSPNDSCCTALGMALVRLLCAKRNVPMNGMMVSLSPPIGPVNAPAPETIFDWNITREIQVEPTKNTPGKSPSKTNKLNVPTKNRSLTSMKATLSPSKRNIDTLQPIDEDDLESKLYTDVNNEYTIKLTELLETVAPLVAYLFDFKNMVDEISDEQQRAILPDKSLKAKAAASKVLKEPTKPSKEAIWQNPLKDSTSESTGNSAEILRNEVHNRIKSTIIQLLANGAKPSLVRCPQPALVMVIVAGCPELVGDLVRFGADVNEIYPQLLNYTPLDIAVSQPLFQTTLEVVQALLLAGARADRRLDGARSTSPRELPDYQPQPGPTLLHAMLAKKAESDFEEDIRKQIMHLLLEHNCDPLTRYHGRSAMEEATKNLDLLDIIINHPKTDLNAAIDDSNQTLLVKMFHTPYFKSLGSIERSQTITNLLLFGADPLIACECNGVKYENLFVLVRKTMLDMISRTPEHNTKLSFPKGKENKHVEPKRSAMKGKQFEVKKEKVKISLSDEAQDFKQAIDLMTECSRIIYIRWLQAQLVKNIIRVIYRYKHRHWSMMIKECKNKKAAGLWITAQRCLEIWDHLKTTEKKVYNDRTILWNLLCITHFFHLRSVTPYGFNKVTAEERDDAESYARSIMKDHKKNEVVPMKRYVQPELFVKEDSKFNVCFECFLPLTEERVLCKSCKFVSFCNLDCLKESIEKSNGHACNDYLILKYLPEPEPSMDVICDDEPHEGHENAEGTHNGPHKLHPK